MSEPCYSLSETLIRDEGYRYVETITDENDDLLDLLQGRGCLLLITSELLDQVKVFDIRPAC